MRIKIIKKFFDFIKKQRKTKKLPSGERIEVWKVVSLFLIVICGFLVIGYFVWQEISSLEYFSKTKFASVERPNIEEPKPIFNFYRLLDGVGVENEEDINPPIFAVQIENMVGARPLSGISKANLVYEAISEAGITRFLALYTADQEVLEIGPVRSARPYYIDWAEEYGALYAHSGGSPEALRIVRNYEILDLNEFSNGQYFWRSKSRYAPHNLYTSVELLRRAWEAKGGEVKNDFDGWEFKEEIEWRERPREEKFFTIHFSSLSYEVGWQYDQEKNDYLRYQAGEVQKDKDGSEVRAKNIVVQFTKMRTLDFEGRKKIDTIGRGEAIIFQDGVKIEGKWKKERKGERTKFYDSAGLEIKFNPGVTWIEVVPIGTKVEF